MNQRQELQALFERTQADEPVILRRMAAAARRRTPPTVAAAAVAWGVAAACSLGLVLYWVSLPPLPPPAATEPRITAEPSTPAAALHRNRSASTPIRAAPSPNTPRPQPSPASRAALRDQSEPMGSTRVAAPPKQDPGAAAPAALAPEPSGASWQAVAEALRSGNREKATSLLDDLARSSDPEVRDAAELVRLQSALREAGAQTPTKPPTTAELGRLEALARTGATASIRASARKLLVEARRSSVAP